MAATITVQAGANTRVFKVNDINQARIITALERSGFQRDPDGSTFELDGDGNQVLDGDGNPIPIPAQNDFGYFTTWLKSQYSELLYRTERRAAQQGVTYDPDAIDTP